MWNPNAMENRQLEKRVVVGRVRPTWARNLPQTREDEDKSDQEAGVMPHSEPPSPTEPWEQHHVKQEDKYDVFGKVSYFFVIVIMILFNLNPLTTDNFFFFFNRHIIIILFFLLSKNAVCRLNLVSIDILYLL